MLIELATLTALGFTNLVGPTHHVQGIDVEGEFVWVSAVEKATHKGFLSRFNAKTGQRLAMVEVQDGERYHPGGLQLSGDSIWLPVAEYRRESSAWIQKRNKHTLALEAQFPVADHIGCVAISNGVIWGGNWDSRHFYRWRPDGSLIDKRPNSTGTGFQDLKLRDGSLIGNGVKTPTSGTIEWLHPESLTVQRSISTGRTDRNVRYSNEGMAIDKDILYLLPEDDPSRLFRFRLP
ncbi:MAG: DUF6454 family protein [Acidobacteria bacterium]|nr:DUF6454 family protein [Acidobacteriota bacterium]